MRQIISNQYEVYCRFFGYTFKVFFDGAVLQIGSDKVYLKIYIYLAKKMLSNFKVSNMCTNEHSSPFFFQKFDYDFASVMLIGELVFHSSTYRNFIKYGLSKSIITFKNHSFGLEIRIPQSFPEIIKD